MKKWYFFILLFSMNASYISAQVSVNSDGSEADASAMLDVVSTTKGMLVPRMTTTQRTNISNAANGLLVFDETTASFWFYKTSTGWEELSSGSSSVSEIDDLSDGIYDGSNLFLGNGSGNSTVSGTHNMALGYECLPSVTTGYANFAFGYRSLNQNTSGKQNTAISSQGLYLNTTGDANTAIGLSALFSNISGSYNVGIGMQSLLYNKTGNSNTAIGSYSGLNNNNSGNIFIGFMAGYNETGSSKLYIENSSSATPLIGGDFSTNQVDINGTIKITGGTPGANKVLTSDADGNATWENTGVPSAMSIDDLTDGKTGGSSVFLGTNAGVNDDGTTSYNTALGQDALKSNIVGTRNTAVGYQSLLDNTASYNTAIGNYSLKYTTGSKNTAVGYNASPTSNSAYYTTSIGYGSHAPADYSVMIGSNSNTWIGGHSTWHNTSDKRFKNQIKENVSGLNFIMKLRPVTYHFDVNKMNEFIGVPEDEKIDKAIQAKEAIQYTGFIAQEVEQAAQEVNYDFSGVGKPQNEKDYYSLAYAEFVVPLVKAVQEQQKQIETQNSEILQQQKTIESQQIIIEKMSSDIDKIKSLLIK